MEYHGRLFGKIGNKYFDTGRTSSEFDKMQKRIIQLELSLEKVKNGETLVSNKISCGTCKYRLPDDRCSHAQGCESDYELYEQEIRERT